MHLPRMQGVLPRYRRVRRQALRLYYRARDVFFPAGTSCSLNAYGHVMVHTPPPDATGHGHEIVESPPLRAITAVTASERDGGSLSRSGAHANPLSGSRACRWAAICALASHLNRSQMTR